jgi:hypothetical protein
MKQTDENAAELLLYAERLQCMHLHRLDGRKRIHDKEDIIHGKIAELVITNM